MLQDRRVIVSVFIILLLVLGYRLYGLFNASKEEKADVSSISADEEEGKAQSKLEEMFKSSKIISGPKRQVPYYQDSLVMLRNPFLYPEEEERFSELKKGKPNEDSTRANFKLKAIIFSHHTPLALINGTMVKENDVIAGYKVMRITKEEVVLRNEQDEIRLRLEKPKLPGLKMKIIEG